MKRQVAPKRAVVYGELLTQAFYVLASHAAEPDCQDAGTALLAALGDVRRLVEVLPDERTRERLSEDLAEAMACYGLPFASLDLAGAVE